VVIPVCLDDSVGVLDDTLRAHARLAYRGPLTVLLVYHKRSAAGPAAGSRLAEAESELRAAWAGREEGSFRCVRAARLLSAPERMGAFDEALAHIRKIPLARIGAHLAVYTGPSRAGVLVMPAQAVHMANLQSRQMVVRNSQVDATRACLHNGMCTLSSGFRSSSTRARGPRPRMSTTRSNS